MILSDLNPEQQLKVYQQALRDQYRESLYHCCKYLLSYSDLTARTHGDMIKALQSQTKRKLIVMPRGTFKSSIGVVGYSVSRLIQNPNLRILIDSEVYDNSKNFIREIKGHFENQKLIDLYGSFKTDSNWSEGSITIKQRTKILKESSITASGIGAGKTGQHYDLIIHDDLNSPKNSGTPEAREKVWQHYQMNTAILEPEGEIIVIGTRFSADDVIGRIMSQEIEQKRAVQKQPLDITTGLIQGTNHDPTHVRTIP